MITTKPPALLVLENVQRVYRPASGPVHALRGVNLVVERGEFVAVMGASGSGKSTLMNLLGCLDRPRGGRLRIDGHDVAGLAPDELAALRNRLIGFVFQGFHLLPALSALENVELPMLYAEPLPPWRTVRARARELLARVGLSERLDHLPDELSGGQQQRVAIARALMAEPKLLLADEPTGNLDTRTSLEIMALFQELHAEGVTVAMVTHEPELTRFATRVVTMRDGRVVGDERARSPASAAASLAALPREPRDNNSTDAHNGGAPAN